MDAALRKLIDQATAGLPRGWIDSIRTAARGGERVLADRLDGAIASADLSLKSGTGWWWFVDVLQWLLFAAALTGLVWLALPLAFVFFQLPIALPHVTFWGWPAPTVLVALGVAGGLVLAGISRIGVEIGARFKARAARGILMERIARVTSTDVLAPVQAELDRLAGAREAVKRAR